MALKKPLIDLSQSQLTRNDNGTVTIDDPSSPLIIHVRCIDNPVRITDLSIRSRHPSGMINTSSLLRLPLTEICQIISQTSQHPNDAIWRMSITPKIPGTRTWPDAHWQEVLQVCAWAKETDRPGGPVQAVADLWNVSRIPTAYRWIRHARSLTTSA